MHVISVTSGLKFFSLSGLAALMSGHFSYLRVNLDLSCGNGAILSSNRRQISAEVNFAFANRFGLHWLKFTEKFSVKGRLHEENEKPLSYDLAIFV